MNRNRNGQPVNRFQRRYHPYRHELQVGARNNAENPLIRLCKENIPEGGDVLALQLTYQLELFSMTSTAPPLADAGAGSSENNENENGNTRRNLSSETSGSLLSPPGNREKSYVTPVATPSSSSPMGRFQVSQSSVGSGNNNFGSNYAHGSGNNQGNGGANSFRAQTPRSQYVSPRGEFVTPRNQSLAPRSQAVTPRSQFVTPVRNTVEQFPYPSPSASRSVINVAQNVFTPSHRSHVTPASYHQGRLHANDFDSKST